MTHPYPKKYGVVKIPADTDRPIEYAEVENSLSSLQSLVGGGYIEIVRTALMPKMACGCDTVMVIDEDGLRKMLPQNPRAENLYPFAPIVGDAFLIGEGYVRDDEGLEEPDFVPLGPEWANWEGPGAPSPTPTDERYEELLREHLS